MADDQRRFPPTARKLRRARQRGEVAQSPLLGAALCTTGVAATIALRADTMGEQLGRLVSELWSADSMTSAGAPAEAMTRASSTLVDLLLWPLGVALALGVFASFAQVGPLFAPDALRLDVGRLDLLRGLRRAFGLRSMLPRLSAMLLVPAILLLAGHVFVEALPGLAARGGTDAQGAVALAGGVVGSYAVRVAVLLSLTAAAAVAYRRYRYWLEQHMSRREILDELRQTEGDPIARRRRRELARRAALSPTLTAALSEASLLVYGAQGVAILRWADPTGAPSVSFAARGALRGRVLAMAARDRLVRDDTLAEKLLAVPVGASLPRALWPRVAKWLAKT